MIEKCGVFVRVQRELVVFVACKKEDNEAALDVDLVEQVKTRQDKTIYRLEYQV